MVFLKTLIIIKIIMIMKIKIIITMIICALPREMWGREKRRGVIR